MPPKEQASCGSSTSSRSKEQSQLASNARQPISFVNSQDPNSRSAIQRHTAHHSNAQRRNARLQSLRGNRPRLLEWQRRSSMETDGLSVASAQSGTSSASISPAAGLRTPLSAPGDISTELASTGSLVAEPATVPQQLASDEQPAAPLATTLSDEIIEIYLQGLCPLAQRDNYRKLIQFIRGKDTCSNYLLIAYILACQVPRKEDPQPETDLNDAHRFYGRATRLLRDRLTIPETASSDENIQAVLLLIAYAADTGATEEVPIHIGALSRMIKERGGIQALEVEVDSVLMLQIQAICQSRRGHLTLQCRSDCTRELRFPRDIEYLALQDAIWPRGEQELFLPE